MCSKRRLHRYAEVQKYYNLKLKVSYVILLNLFTVSKGDAGISAETLAGVIVGILIIAVPEIAIALIIICCNWLRKNVSSYSMSIASCIVLLKYG